MFALLREEMTVPRIKHTATLLRNGKVLIAGGNCAVSAAGPVPGLLGRWPAAPAQTPKAYLGGSVGPLAPAELYDPAKKSFVLTGSMGMPRSQCYPS